MATTFKVELRCAEAAALSDSRVSTPPREEL